MVDRWGVVPVIDGEARTVEEVDAFLARVGIRGTLPNARGAAPERVHPHLAAAVEAFRWEIRRLRNDAAKHLSDQQTETIDRLAVLEDQHMRQLKLNFETGVKTGTRRQNRRKRQIEDVRRLFDNWSEWFEETCVLADDPDPFVEIKAVFEG